MTAKLPFQIEIPRRANICIACKINFSANQKYLSTISDDDTGKLLRNDYCEKCWEPLKDTDLMIKTYWKAIVPEKKQQSERSVNRDERALELLKEAISKNTSEDDAEAFVLALYLVRRRLIAYRQQVRQDDGKLVNLYEIVATEEILCVRNVSLSHLQVESLQNRIAEKLSEKKEVI